MRLGFVGLIWLAVVAVPAKAADPGAKDFVERIRSLGKEGTGNKEASLAWRSAVAAGPDALLPILDNYDASNPVARNWLRMAVDAILEKPLPTADWIKTFETYLLDSSKGPEGRKLAYDALKKLDPKAPDRLLPKLLADRNVAIRREAITAHLGTLALSKTGDPKGAYAELFEVSRDQDQVLEIGEKLKQLGAEPDYQKHLGIIAHWQLLGPFDSQDGKAYTIPLPPDAGVDLSAKYAGKNGKEIAWIPFETKDNFGRTDLNKALSKFKNAVAYAYATVDTDREMDVDLRIGSLCAVRVFLNGRDIFASEEYHHGVRFDQYFIKAKLKAGRNELLLKLLQNNQTDVWAQDWIFQARFCDETGGALPIRYGMGK